MRHPICFFGEFGGDTVYGEYTTTVVFNSASNTSNEVYSATVYPDINWNREFPTDMTGNYRVMIFFKAVYQRLNHYSYGNVTQSYTYKYFNYTGTKSGHFRVPEYTFYIEQPTDDPLGFKNWLYYEISILLFLPDWNSGDPADFISDAVMSVQYNDVIKQF